MAALLGCVGPADFAWRWLVEIDLEAATEEPCEGIDVDRDIVSPVSIGIDERGGEDVLVMLIDQELPGPYDGPDWGPGVPGRIADGVLRADLHADDDLGPVDVWIELRIREGRLVGDQRAAWNESGGWNEDDVSCASAFRLSGERLEPYMLSAGYGGDNENPEWTTTEGSIP